MNNLHYKYEECVNCNGKTTLLYDCNPVCSRCMYGDGSGPTLTSDLIEFGEAWDNFFNELGKGLNIEEAVARLDRFVKCLRKKIH